MASIPKLTAYKSYDYNMEVGFDKKFKLSTLR
jgi:hypothetical protein